MNIVFLIIGVAIGIVATVVYNRYFPAKIDKASKELGEEIDKVVKKK